MNDRSRAPGRSQGLDLQRHQPLAVRDRLGSSALNIYVKLLSAFAFVVNFVIIARVPVGAVAERVTHTAFPSRSDTRRDQVTTERVGK